jgi:hypothetical protein
MRPRHLAKLFALLVALTAAASAQTNPPSGVPGVFEHTFASHKTYTDPFNDVDVDVIFTRGTETWRVPTFWRGGSSGANKWTVRFAPPTAGDYSYRLESTDHSNPDLNGHETRVHLTTYAGTNPLLKHGMPRVSADKRYFEQADGTPFYWLGDTWWTGLSDRLPWEGFQKLTADRKAKGFSVVQIVAGLVPSNEEVAPIEPGDHDEGGQVWDPKFKQINPKFFDYADRRIQLLVNSGIAPAIVGAWHQALPQMGIPKMETHWRYIIARYGAYPVFWITGGEVFDPSPEIENGLSALYGKSAVKDTEVPGWSEVTRYIRATDPYHHPLTVHEIPPPYNIPLNDESLTDFDLFQPSHFGWPSIAIEVAELGITRSRTAITKPEVIGEIGYEGIGGTNLQDFQRAAFWLAMLNGAAGYTYGSNPVFESYSNDKPFQRTKYTLMTWNEGIDLPGAYEISIGAKLLKKYPWWQADPHPEWVAPRGTTLLTPRANRIGSEIGDFAPVFTNPFPAASGEPWIYPAGEWKAQSEAQHSTLFMPYAFGVPGKFRIIYDPCFSLFCATPPTVLGLEPGIRYHAYYWEPVLGVKFDLGSVERPTPGTPLSAPADFLATSNQSPQQDEIAAIDTHSNTSAEPNSELVLRYHDADNYVAAVYSPEAKAIYLLDRAKGKDGNPLGSMPASTLGPNIHLTAEVKGAWAIASVTDGTNTYTTSIAAVTNTTAGTAGLRHQADAAQSYTNFELRKPSASLSDEHLEKKLYDAKGGYRGELKGTVWDDFGKEKTILLDAYQPPPLPMPQDWILVLENTTTEAKP